MANRPALRDLVTQALGDSFTSADYDSQEALLEGLENDRERTRSLLSQLDPVFAAKTKEDQDRDLIQLVNETSWAGTIAAAPVGAAGGIVEGAGGIIEGAGQLIGGQTGGAPGKAIADVGQSMVEWAQPVAPADSWKPTVSSGVTSAAQTSAAAVGGLMAGVNPAVAIPVGLGLVSGGTKAHEVINEQLPGTDPRLTAAKGLGMGAVVGTAEALGERLIGAAPLFNRLEEASKALGLVDGGKALLKSLMMSMPGEMTEEVGQAILGTALDRTMGSGKWGPMIPEERRPEFLDELRANIKEAALVTPIAVLAQGAIHRSVRSVVGGRPLPTDLGSEPGGTLPSPEAPVESEAEQPVDASQEPIIDLRKDQAEDEVEQMMQQAEQQPAEPDVPEPTVSEPNATVVTPDGAIEQTDESGGIRPQFARATLPTAPAPVDPTTGESVPVDGAPERVAPPPRPTPMKLADVQIAAGTVTTGWSKDAPEVVVVQSTADLKNEGIRVKPGQEVAGVHLNGMVYLVADNLPTPADVERTMMHEVAAHYGFERLAGADLRPILAQVLHVARTDPAMKQVMENVRGLYPEYGQTELAKEVLGNMAEHLNQPGLSGALGRLVEKIERVFRQAMRKLGFKLVLTRREIMDMLRVSWNSAANGQIRPGPKTTPAQFMYAGRRAREFSGALAANRTFKGIEGDDRFRISDKDAKLNTAALQQVGRTKVRRYVGPLSGLIGHVELFRNYPELANVSVDVSVGGKSNLKTLGYAVPGGLREHAKEIVVHPGQSEAEVLKTLIHEIQHSIQNYENHAAGGGVRPDLVRMVAGDPEMSRIEQQLRGMAMNDPAAAPLLEARADRYARLYNNWEGYGRLGGEIEARDAAETMGLDQAALDATAPYRSQTEINLDDTAPKLEFLGLKGKTMVLSVQQRNKKLKGMTLNQLPVRVLDDLGAHSLVVHERTGQRLLVDNADMVYDPNVEKMTSDDKAFDQGAMNFFGVLKLMRLVQTELAKELPGHSWFDALKLVTRGQLPSFSITKDGPKIRMSWDFIARYPAYATRIFAANMGEFIDYLDSSLPYNSKVRTQGNILAHLIGLWRTGLQTVGAVPFENVSPQNRVVLEQVLKDTNASIEKRQAGPNPLSGKDLDKFARSEYQRIFEQAVKQLDPQIDPKVRGQVYAYASKVARRAMLGAEKAKLSRMPKHWLDTPAKRAQYVAIRQRVYYKELQRMYAGNSPNDLLYAPMLHMELTHLRDALHGGEIARMQTTRGLYSAFISAYLTQPIIDVDGKAVNALNHFAPTFKQAFENYLDRKPQFRDALKELRVFLASSHAQYQEFKDRMRQADVDESAKNADKVDPERNQGMMLKIRRQLVNRAAALYDAITDLPRAVRMKVQNAIELAAGNMSMAQVLIEAYDRLVTKHFGDSPDLFEHLGPYLALSRIASSERTKVLKSEYVRYEIDPTTGKRVKTTTQVDETVELMNMMGVQGAEQAREMLKAMFEQPGMRGQEARFAAFLSDMTAMRQSKLIPDLEASQVFGKYWLEKVKNAKSYSTNMVVDYINNSGGSAGMVKNYKEQFGSAKDIVNPLHATMLTDMSLVHTVRTETMKKISIDALRQAQPDLVRAAKKDPNGRYMEPRDPRWELVEYMHQGQIYGYELPLAIADGLKAPDRAAVPIMANINRWYRKIFTNFNLPFVLKNPFRDLLSAVTNIRGGANWSLKPGAELQFIRDWLSAAWDVIKGNVSEAERDYLLRNAIAYSTQDALNADPGDTMGQRIMSGMNSENAVIRADNAKLRAKTANAGMTLLNEIWDRGPGKYFNYVQNFAAGGEVITKLAAKRFYEQNYGIKRDAQGKVISGFMESEEIDLRVRNEIGTPNGLTQGKFNRFAKCIFLFSNMFIQGNLRDIHTMLGGNEGWRAGTRVMAKRLTFTMALQMVYAGLAYGVFKSMFGWDEDEDLSWAIRAIDHRDRANYVCIPFAIVEQDEVLPGLTGQPGATGGKRGKVLYMRLPLDQSSQMLSSTLFAMLNSSDGAFEITNLASKIASDLPTSSPFLQTMKLAIDIAQGKNPTDSSGFPLIPHQSFAAGGAVMAKDVARAAWNWSGVGPAIWRLKPGSDFEIRTQLEQLVDFPIGERLFSSFFKVSNKGIADEVRVLSEKARAEIDNLKARIKVAAQDPSGGAMSQLLSDPSKLTQDQLIWIDQYGEQMIRESMVNWGYEITQDRELLEWLKADTMTRRKIVESRMKGGKQ